MLDVTDAIRFTREQRAGDGSTELIAKIEMRSAVVLAPNAPESEFQNQQQNLEQRARHYVYGVVIELLQEMKANLRTQMPEGLVARYRHRLAEVLERIQK